MYHRFRPRHNAGGRSPEAAYDAPQIGGRVHPGVRRRARDLAVYAVAVRERAQLLERLEALNRRGLEARECAQERRAVL
jgi:hypothetical protein